MIKNAKYYCAQGTNPYQNIADEAILLESVAEDEIILFLWQNQHTIVIGRNQNAWAECDVEALQADGGHLTRRLSGGGAVYHDLGNINFTFLVSEKHYDLDKQNKVIQLAMESLGLNIERSGRNDLLIDGRKFSGHAYFKQRGKSYHHGTILLDVDTTQMAKYLRVSKNKLESKGVKSVRSRVANLVEFLPNLKVETIYQAFIDACRVVYGIDFNPASLDALDQNYRAEKKAFFQSDDWLYGPKIPLTLSTSQRFTWGEVTMEMAVNAGQIKTVRIYSDAMEWAWAKALSEFLIDKPFKQEYLLNEIDVFFGQLKEENFSPEAIDDVKDIIRALFQ